MRSFVHGTLAVLAALACTTVLPTIAGQIPFPNLVLIGTGLAIFSDDRSAAWVWAVLGGLTLDLAIADRPFYTLFLVVFVWITSVIIDRWQLRPSVAFVATGMVISAITFVALEWFMGRNLWAWQLLWAVVSNLVGYLLIWSIVRSFRHRQMSPTTIR